ncbi:OmpA family protein [Maliponia aquimaris]|uniref:Putative lipoprotein YiaD n=1 Tax=Maliponia aquimaris TaxID=1673631 RepID=A0A238L0N1_9RHOB|nr:OmpA family protein [Maliponia aquimaris]SMX47886.1 putative lipoprotein YiaD precursor [Maliponia aquimaris]
MCFMFFESFKFPTATVTARLDPAQLSDLPKARRKRVDIPFVLDLHGVRRQMETRAIVTLLSENAVAVSTSEPISVAASDFGLTEGIEKLTEASGFEIVPSVFVSFDFVFSRDGAAGLPDAAVIRQEVILHNSAVELDGNLDREACKGRFESLSGTGNIHFGTGSASLQPDSLPLLRQVVDIVSRCPGMTIEVGGYTDSGGGAAANFALSEARARSVSASPTSEGVDDRRILSVGYGEASPVAPNDTLRNKVKNRRIEFAMVER